MTRQIKRTRQIEDFVIEKLARRGLISEKEKENSAQFVKGKGDSQKNFNFNYDKLSMIISNCNNVMVCLK